MLNIFLVNLNKYNTCLGKNIKIIIINHLRLPVGVFGKCWMVFVFVADLSLLRIQNVKQVETFFRRILISNALISLNVLSWVWFNLRLV